jgi:hypothetical protein
MIADGADIKTVQARMRHALATTSTGIYGRTQMSPPIRLSVL